MAGCVVLSLCTVLTANVPQQLPGSGEFALAQEFLYALYPDLLERQTTFRFSRTEGKIVVSAADAINPMLEKPGERVEPLVDAIIAFTSDRKVATFTADGVLLDKNRNGALARTLREHPTWTDIDVLTWLANAGARNSESSTSLATTLLTRLRRFLPGTAELSDGAFHVRDEKSAAAVKPFRGRVGHVANVRATDASGKVLHYALEFEPFGGRLTAVTRQ